MSVEVANESGIPIDVETVSEQSRFLLDALRIHPQAELSVLFVDESTMTDLHGRWLDEPGPTDVLAFPMDEIRPTEADEEPEPGLLGDVVICPQVADRQAREAGHRVEDEFALLLTHGLLHLLGYDHADPEEHRTMFGLQTQLLAQWQGHLSERPPRAIRVEDGLL
jgi:probable rRNA maturation factor